MTSRWTAFLVLLAFVFGVAFGLDVERRSCIQRTLNALTKRYERGEGR